MELDQIEVSAFIEVLEEQHEARKKSSRKGG
jgi:hypothetical protein